MRLHELFRPETIDAAGDMLKRAGYDEVGSGTWSSIYHKMGGNFAVKLFKKGDIAFIHYLKLISQVSNPHFPVIKGKPTKVNDSYYGVQIEKLDPLTPEMEQQFQQIDWDHPDNIPGTLGEAMRLVRDHVYMQSGVIPDINLGSVMRRGDTLVIVDPAEPW